MTAVIRVLYSDTTYDVVVGENIHTNKIVAAIIDYNSYIHPNSPTDIDNIVYIPESSLIEIKLDNPAHAIPIIKNAPIISEIANHPSLELIIVCPCYNIFYLLQKIVHNKKLIWSQTTPAPAHTHIINKARIPIVDVTSISTNPQDILSIAKSLLSQLKYVSSNIEYVNMTEPGFGESIRHSPTTTRFFKVCSWSELSLSF
jgi:hypothetical protein